MNTHFNNLTPAEHERLALLLEELGEAQQIIGKIFRHGYESSNPFDSENVTNRHLLEKELGDVHCALRMMFNAGDISAATLARRAEMKRMRIGQWLHHNLLDAED